MKITFKNILFLIGLCVVTATFSQERKLLKAEEAYQQYEYVEAQERYLHLIEKGEKSADIYQKLGNTYYFNSQYEDAAKWYKTLITEYPDEIEAEYYFRYAQSLKALKQYDESDKYMKLLASKNSEDHRAKVYNDIPDYLKKIKFQSGRYEVINLAINSPFSDFGPSFYQDKIVFSSARDTLVFSRNLHQWNDKSFLDLYSADIEEETGELSNLDKLNKKVNTKYHESTSVFTSDGNTMYFTRNNYTKRKYREAEDGTNKLKIYKTTKDEKGRWTTPVPLSFTSDEFSTAHPALSADEKTLYFTSDMPGGYGLSDIYKVAINADGSFGEPVNLGDRINTEGRDSFPYVSDKDELYFASNGHIGLGGFDIYVTPLNPKNEEEGRVLNIGEPANSPKDDFAYVFDTRTKRGYFSSNRDGGKGSDDIYTFVELEPLKDPCKVTITGVVKDKKTKEILPGTLVVIFDKDEQELNSVTTGPEGKYSFDVKCKATYTIKASKEKYKTTTEVVTTPDGTETIEVPLELEPIPEEVDLGKLLALKPIYFDFDQAKIRDDAAIELDKVVAAMQKYPELVIEVRSHTDSQGTTTYNLKLSDKRAKATATYIIDKGITKERISGRGLGESELTNKCGDGVNCKEEEHQLNRRSEFIIIKEAATEKAKTN